MKNLLFILILGLFIFLANNTQAQTSASTHKTIQVQTEMVDLSQLDEFGTVEYVETKGSRILVETYVGVKGGNKVASMAANKVTPQVEVHNNTTVLTVEKQININGEDVVPHYKVFVPTKVKYVN